jgi:hypothetical protein
MSILPKQYIRGGHPYQCQPRRTEILLHGKNKKRVKYPAVEKIQGELLLSCRGEDEETDASAINYARESMPQL